MSQPSRVALALGSNLGDRVGNLVAAIKALSTAEVKVIQLSKLYESAAAYVTDQPSFLNAAAVVTTDLPPLPLLHRLKTIEAELGRDFNGQRWGPRPIDLDIIFYEDAEVHDGDRLIIPHPRWQERDFVIAPLADLVPPHPTVDKDSSTMHHLHNGLDRRLAIARQLWEAAGGEQRVSLGCDAALRCVIAMGRQGVWNYLHKTQVMGILNVTPDSFSDGGRHVSLAAALAHARRMVDEGADILDVGGQSTRPGAHRLTPKEEADRVIPIIRSIADDPRLSAVPLSVDTFSAEVAEAAVGAGATMVNDVSGGTLDSEMFSTVAKLGVSYVLMHMRGTPQTMQSPENTSYDDVCSEVAVTLQERGERAIAAGIEPWRLILDPGLGFAKTMGGNLVLIKELARLRGMLLPPLQGLPMLVGPSRKGFLGKITGRTVAEDRDWATAAAAALCVREGASMIRAHNVAAVRDAVRLADALNRC